MERPKVVSPAEWLDARQAYLKKEKEFTHRRDELSRQRRELPWERVEKGYVFEGPNGKRTLADLFDGRSQLIVYHFMFGPEWKRGLPKLLVGGRSFRRQHRASECARRDPGGNLPSVLPADRCV